MGKVKPVVLGSVNFESQKEALLFFKAMLNRYMPHERISSADSLVLADLLKRHSEYQSKIGSGIDHFEVMPAEYGTQCFCIVRVDGTKVDFSYPHCVTTLPR